MFALNALDVDSGTLTIPEYGVWHARLRLTTDKSFVRGELAELVMGDLSLRGRIRSGGPHVGASEYLVVGGADGWVKRVQKRPYRTGTGVKLREVATDLAQETGEMITVLRGVDRDLGYAWSRPECVASSVLRDLGVKWWVEPDGTTKVGKRPFIGKSTAKLSVSSYDPSFKMAALKLADDELSKVLPGYLVEDDLISIRVRSLDLYIQGQKTTYLIRGA